MKLVVLVDSQRRLTSFGRYANTMPVWDNQHAKFGGAARRRFQVICEKQVWAEFAPSSARVIPTLVPSFPLPSPQRGGQSTQSHNTLVFIPVFALSYAYSPLPHRDAKRGARARVT